MMSPVLSVLHRYSPAHVTITAQLAFNTAMQIVVTVLMVYRILSVTHDSTLAVSSLQKRRRRALVQCFIESGGIVTVGTVVNLALFAQGSLSSHSLDLAIFD